MDVDRRTFAQRADTACTFRLTWPSTAASSEDGSGTDVRVTSTMQVTLDADGLIATIDLEAYDGDELVMRREWTEQLPP